jgi:hypothetical protein
VVDTCCFADYQRAAGRPGAGEFGSLRFGFGEHPPLTATLDGHTVVIPVSVSPYPGPGEYSRDHGVQLGPGVVIDETNYAIAEDGRDYDVTVLPDGSGSFTFANLHLASWSADPTIGPAISGSDTWSCSQVTNP